VRELATEYIGCDALQYAGFPSGEGVRFVAANLNTPPYDVPAGCASAVVSVETIEHLENPRSFFRELVRLVRPGGLVVVTTPNQLSLMSKLTLLAKNEFNAFQDRPGLYPAHVTALLEVDLLRIAREVGLRDIAIHYSNVGRIPGTRRRWPAVFGFRGRAFSDNVAVVARAG
jgi:SAM-dependent methyltransferase